jgi:signal transduction histidine kinase
MIAAKILVVEDERIVALHIRQQLSRLGYQVPSMATNAAQALKQIEELRPDIVLMDIHIEGKIDGIHTASLIPPEFQTPVIYLSAFSDEPTLARARATQPYGYLLKPFSERELHAVIQMVLERRRADLSMRESEQRLEQLVAARTEALVIANRKLELEIVERLKTEQMLHQAQKMEMVGQLSGGIAHDFNNALMVIIGNIERIQNSGELKSLELVRALDGAARRATLAATLTQRLLAFSRLQPLEPKAVNLNKLVIGMAELLRGTLGESVSIELALFDEPWRIFADENQLENALLNLVINSRDAMPDGGMLTIETGNAELDEAYAARHSEVAPGQYGVIAVSDTGTGMSKTIRDKAFEPFFTTKEVGQGTGLGLSQVYGFVKQSGGHVKIYSEPQIGSTVRIYLPRLPDDQMSIEALPEYARAMAGSPAETILVVEDEHDVRDCSVAMLGDLGYRVLEAHDGPEALRMLDEEPAVNLVFADVGLPGGLNGRDLVDEVLRRRPGLPILFTTGYAPDAIADQGRLKCGDKLLAKPFTQINLAAKIREVLESKH